MSQQGYRQASIRAVTGSAEALEGDWHRLFDAASIPAGPFNGRMLAWINSKLGTSYVNLVEAEQALANYGLAYNFSSLGTFTASSRINAPFSKVNGPTDGPTSGPYESWSANYSGTPPTISSPVPFTLGRQGYDANAAATTYYDTAYITNRVRQVYPNGTSPSANTVSLSEWVYSTDTVYGGATNNSTFVSPKPTANWVLPHRSVVGNSLTLEVVAFHPNARSGKQVPCVVFSATDGTTTVTSTVSSCTVSTQSTDKNAVYVYACTLDITSLTNDALVTVNASVYPWIGAASSVALSSSGSALKDFSPRYYLKSTSKASAPSLIYVSTTGNDSTCVISTDPVAASAAPALTIAGAFNKIQNAGMAVDGIQIRLKAGTFAMGGPTINQMTQNVGCLTVTRDPNVARASVTLTFGNDESPRLTSGLTAPVATGCLRITDIQVTRAANLTIRGGFGGSGARMEVQWVDVDMNLGGFSGTYLNLSDDSFYGATVTNVGTNMWAKNAAGQHRVFRGVTVTMPNAGVEAITVVGCTFTGGGVSSTFTETNGGTAEGMIFAYNKVFNVTNTTFFTISTAVTNGCAIVQNLFEYTSASSGYLLGVSNDNLTNSTYGVIIHNNTFAGFWGNGRVNIFYDDGATTRTNKAMSVKGNIFVSIAMKGDTFMSSGTRIGNFGPTYGCGFAGNLVQYIDVNNGGGGPPATFAMAYVGINSTAGTSNSTPNMANSEYTLYRATTSGPIAGAGSGTYTGTLTQAKALNPVGLLPGDLAGVARSAANDDAGAYKAA